MKLSDHQQMFTISEFRRRPAVFVRRPEACLQLARTRQCIAAPRVIRLGVVLGALSSLAPRHKLTQLITERIDVAAGGMREREARAVHRVKGKYRLLLGVGVARSKASAYSVAEPSRVG